MLEEGPPPPKPSRTRLYSVVLIIITLVVVTLAVLLPIVYSQPTPPSSPTPGTNVNVDTYAPGSGWVGQYGDDPAVAVAPNGTIAVAWEGLDELAPPATPGASPNFTTEIFVSFSSDGGAHYSTPLAVGAPGTASALLPSLAFGPYGTLYLAYANATNTNTQQILVVSAPPGQPFGTPVMAAEGQQLGRPLIFVTDAGIVGLAYMYSQFVEWTTSSNGGQSFAPPTILLQGILTGGTLWGGNEVTLVGLNAGASSFTTVSIWSDSVNVPASSLPMSGTVATIDIPFPYSAAAANLSRPGPAVTEAGGILYLVYASDNETELTLASSANNGTSWAGPYTLWTAHNASIETPEVETGPRGTTLALGWESTSGGYWKTYAALFSVRTGLLSTPATASSAAGFPSTVRNWHGMTMGLGVSSSDQFVLVWGDGRGLTGVYGLTHIWACTLTGPVS